MSRIEYKYGSIYVLHIFDCGLFAIFIILLSIFLSMRTLCDVYHKECTSRYWSILDISEDALE